MKQAYIAFHTEAVVRSHGIKSRGLNHRDDDNAIKKSEKQGRGWQSCNGKVQMHADEWGIEWSAKQCRGSSLGTTKRWSGEQITDHTSDTVWKHDWKWVETETEAHLFDM